MIKNPVFLFVSLIVVAAIVIVFYKVGTDPFLNIKQNTIGESASNPHQSDPIINLYVKNCATCHGNFGQGMGGHPSLQTTKLTVDQIKQVIQSGRGQMPAFPGLREPTLTELAKLVKQFSSNE